MNADRWKKIKDLFGSALEVAEEEREAFLDRECGGDDDLRREVERLLESDRQADSFLEDSAVAEAASLLDSASDPENSASENTPPRFDRGQMINRRYEIVQLLGRGGMGEVYLANDIRIKRKVAIKVLHSNLISSKEGLRRFALETQAVSALNHPHIMTIYEFDNADDGSVFFAAEYIEGRTLNHAIVEGISVDQALDIAAQVCLAISAAHEAGITHRDIKPENIILRPDGYIKVLDFGLAKLTQTDAAPDGAGSEDPTMALSTTRPGAVMGTTAYMSPEQARGLNVDARTDIWSLGAVIYEMLTGRRPFVGDTPADVVVGVLSHDPKPLSTYSKSFTPDIQFVVSKALSKDRNGRYQTARELRVDLERIRSEIQFDERLERSKSSDRHDHEVKSSETIRNVTATSPDGHKLTEGGRSVSFIGREASKTHETVGSTRVHRRFVVYGLAASCLAIVVSAFAYLTLFPTAVKGKIDSVAVLPFASESNGELSYAAEGLSEELIDQLSQLPQLKVISRSSSFRFRGPEVDIQDAARQLGARAIVTGRVTRVDDELAIKLEIVDTAEDRVLESRQYRRKASELKTLRSEIGRAATQRLGMELTSEQDRRLQKQRTEDSEAYRYYLNGLVEMNSQGSDTAKALEYFERAVDLDPDFAAAHAEIAWNYWAQANASGDPASLMPKARIAAERALALDPDLAKAHVVQATIKENEFDWRGAEAEYRRAIELNPNLDFARNNFAFFLSILGRQEEALAQLDQQQLRDPINRRLGLLHRAIILVQGRRFDDALIAYQQAQAVEPARKIPEFALGYAYAGKGAIGQAVTHYEKSVESLGGKQKYSQPLIYLAATYARIPEKRAEAIEILTRLENTSGYTSPALLAALHCALGDNDKAMQLLERAYVERDILLRYIGIAYEYDDLRSDPRFVELIRRTGVG